MRGCAQPLRGVDTGGDDFKCVGQEQTVQVEGAMPHRPLYKGRHVELILLSTFVAANSTRSGSSTTRP